jgi:ATP-dependent exoDNAse (exonuclease V) beta subunit
LNAEDEAGRFARTLDVLREVRPLDRGLTCAVLVRTNHAGARLADYLRREGGLPALAEADLQVCIDNPLGTAFLALAKAAAHPGDTLAREHVRMTPLGTVLAAEGLTDPDALSLRMLGELHADGFEHTIEIWLRRLEPHLAPDDAFSRERGAQFAAAARRFDESGSRDVMEFIRFMERHTEREAESASAVRVMTIHKAKGLSFDLVILPDLEGNKLDQRREGLAVQRSADRSVEWVLDLPPRQICGPDGVLSAHIKAAEAEACYENFSLLYVAMTRARRAMYIIIKPPGNSASNNFPRLLATTLDGGVTAVRVGKQTLPGSFATGDPEWHDALGTTAAQDRGETGIPPLATLPVTRSRRLPARRPSQTGMGGVTGAALFSLESRQAADFGNKVHALFSAVEWWNPADQETWAAARSEEGAPEPVVAEALGCLGEPALAEVFAQPAGPAEVWRERPFEVVLDETWVTGVFDRVVVKRDATGNVARVAVIDFKTDRVGDGVELELARDRHAQQLNLYRRVAAILAGVPVAQVTCQLVFTRLRRVVSVPAGA